MSMIAFAAPVDCDLVTTVGDAVGTNILDEPSGCQDQDKIYDLWSTDLPDDTGLEIDTVVGISDFHTVSVGSLESLAGNTFFLQYRIYIDPATVDYALRNIVLVTLDADIAPPNQISITKTYWSDDFDGGEVGSMTTTGPPQQDSIADMKQLYVRDEITFLSNAVLNSASNGFQQDVNNPIPEPSTYGLLGSGLIALGFLHRRRRTQRRS
jgi:hypothetical protein